MASATAPCHTTSVSSSLSYHPSPAPSSPTSSTSSQTLRKRKRDEFPAIAPIPPLVTPPPDSEAGVPAPRPMYPLQLFASLWVSLKSLAGIGSTDGSDLAAEGDEVPESLPKRVCVDHSSGDGENDSVPDDERNKESIASTIDPVPAQDSNKEPPRPQTSSGRVSLKIKAPTSIDKQTPPTQQLPSPLASSSEDEGEAVVKKATRPVRPLQSKMAAPLLAPLVAGPLGKNEPPFFTKPLPKRSNPEAMLQRALQRRSEFGPSKYPRLPPTFLHHASVPRSLMKLPLAGLTREFLPGLPAQHIQHASTYNALRSSVRRNQRRTAYSGRVEKSIREAYMKSKVLNMNELTVILDQLNKEKVQGFQSLSEVEKRRKERAVEIERLRKKELEDKLKEKIPPLTVVQAGQYNKIIGEIRNRLVSDKKQYNPAESRVPITKYDLSRIAMGGWLNDESINCYLEMIAGRANVPGKPKKVIAFNSFFYSNLSQGKSVARWAKRQGAGGDDMLKLDYVIIPINIGGSHWVVAIVNLKLKRFEYYDSLQQPTVKHQTFEVIRKYFQAETGSDLAGWTNYVMENSPQQCNCNDCGVFSVKTAEVVTRDGKLTFTQDDIPLLRQRLVLECATGKLLPSVVEDDGDEY